MDNLVWLIPVLACPLMMVVMMVMMGKGMSMMGGGKEEAGSDDEPSRQSLAELRTEKQRLEAEIVRREDAKDRVREADSGSARHA
jgi:hypothetical protein